MLQKLKFRPSDFASHSFDVVCLFQKNDNLLIGM
jgi:hypothetical protein